MQLNLVAHPAALPADPPFKVWANVEHSSSFGALASTNIWFGVGAPADRFVIPEPLDPARTDGLWQTTCFEAFLRAEDEEGYREWNFAPSGQWAAYDFTGYRADTNNADVDSPPYVRMEDNFTWWALGATIAVDAALTWSLGLSAILEERGGTKSYWALAHSSEEPDFHAADCFAARLP
jgi:hypothetical protein